MIEAFVYCWTDHLTNRLYVGSHKGSVDDGYICSSKLMKEEYDKRPSDFTRQIVAEGIFTDIRVLEAKLLDTMNVKHDPAFYNQHNGNGDFYCKGHTVEARKKMGAAHKGKNHTEETKNKMSVAMTGKKHKSYYGRPTTEETKQKIIASNKGQKRSQETRNKMSLAHIKPKGITNVNC